MPAAPRVTRREALALGATAGVAATVGLPATSAVGAVGAGSSPEYLRRSTFAPLVGEDFTIGAQTLRLTAVRDVLGAASDASLRDHEEAFTLEFEGAAEALADDVHQVSHPLVGPFPMFVGPEGAVRGALRSYGATVDRSVRVSLGAAQQDDGPLVRATEAHLRSASGSRAGDAPTERDLAILDERRNAALEPGNRRRAAAREARLKLRAAIAERAAFRRAQRARLLLSRSSFLRRPGR